MRVPIVNRKVTYRLYPTSRQGHALADMFFAHRQLYNAALEQRITAYRRCGVSLSFADQCKEVTALRAVCPEYAALNAQSLQVTVKRVERAFEGFFRRCKEGHPQPGFPRFKSSHRFAGWGYKTHGDGWRLCAGEAMRHGRLRLSGVGDIKIRGRARTPGEPKTVEILQKQGHWYASVTVACEPKRRCGKKALGLDWGVATYITAVDSDGNVARIENPRLGKHEEASLCAAQQTLSKKKRGSKNAHKARQRVAAVHSKISRRRHNHLHQTSARIVGDAGLIATEKLTVKNMTRTARGTPEKPGKNVAQKAGLNRNILDTAPAALMKMLSCKAEEAGGEWIEIPTRKVKPSQTCYKCWRQTKKSLSERVHQCPCGLVCDRDECSARVQLAWGLKQRTGREPAWCGPMDAFFASRGKHETPREAAQAAHVE